MDKKIFQEYSEKERIEMLDANADAVEEMNYTDFLTKEELQERKDSLAEISIEESKILDHKKEVMAQIKKDLEPITQEKKTLLTEIKHESINVKDKCYKLIEGNTVGFYSKKGILVYERAARPEERQGTLMQLQRTGTDL